MAVSVLNTFLVLVLVSIDIALYMWVDRRHKEVVKVLQRLSEHDVKTYLTESQRRLSELEARLDCEGADERQ